MDFIKRLSKRQHLWLAATWITMAAIIGARWLVDHRGGKDAAPSVSVDQTIRQLAPQLGATGLSMASQDDCSS